MSGSSVRTRYTHPVNPLGLSVEELLAIDVFLDGGNRIAGYLAYCGATGRVAGDDPVGESREFFKRRRIAAEMARRMALAVERSGVTQARVLEELAAIAFSRLPDAARIENGELVMESFDDLDPRTAAALESVQISEDVLVSGEGEDSGTTTLKRKIKFKMHSKMAALTLLAKHVGIGVESGGKEQLTAINVFGCAAVGVQSRQAEEDEVAPRLSYAVDGDVEPESEPDERDAPAGPLPVLRLGF